MFVSEPQPTITQLAVWRVSGTRRVYWRTGSCLSLALPQYNYILHTSPFCKHLYQNLTEHLTLLDKSPLQLTTSPFWKHLPSSSLFWKHLNLKISRLTSPFRGSGNIPFPVTTSLFYSENISTSNEISDDQSNISYNMYHISFPLIPLDVYEENEHEQRML